MVQRDVVIAAPLRNWALMALMAVALGAAEARAQDFVGTRALGLAEAYRATATGNDAIYFNPAGLVLIPRYSPEVHYQLDLVLEEHQIDASIVDSKTAPLAAGLGYTFDGQQFTQRASLQHTATLALAYPFFEKMFSVGVGLKYVNVTDAFLGSYLNALSADVGTLVKIPGGLTVAAVGYNVIPIRSARVPLAAGFAANLDLGPLSALVFGGTPTFGPTPNAAGQPTMSGPRGPLSGLTVEVDWYLNLTTLYGIQSRISSGLEYLAFDSVPLRVGYLYDQLGADHRIGLGAGFIVPYFGLDVGYQQSVVAPDSRSFAIALKFFIMV